MRSKTLHHRPSTTAGVDATDPQENVSATAKQAEADRGADAARKIYLSRHGYKKGVNWAFWLTLAGSLVFFVVCFTGLFALVRVLMPALV
ncbi:hypothetical protein [uncultured Martelella sp.]|uniref:hypothetical protein n=1 Tax=uncultured Martelella sp. TaxID=392331 RepID=UPI0029C60A05|nr:hypothetical protein [uncultured Martelella sp.]